MDNVLLLRIGMFVLIIWMLFWKGIALWRSAHYKQRNWFIVMLIFNIYGAIEILYLFRFAKKRLTWEEMKTWKNVFVKQVPEKE